jgi:hypothetical protein
VSVGRRDRTRVAARAGKSDYTGRVRDDFGLSDRGRTSQIVRFVGPGSCWDSTFSKSVGFGQSTKTARDKPDEIGNGFLRQNLSVFPLHGSDSDRSLLKKLGLEHKLFDVRESRVRVG